MVVAYSTRATVFSAVVFLAFCQDREEDGKPDDSSSSPNANTLSNDHVVNAYAEIDANGDNKVSKDELLDFLDKHEKSVSLVDLDMDAEFTRRDTSKDGRISLEEFLAEALKGFNAQASDTESLRESLQNARSKAEKESTEMFRAVDADGDGFIDKSELPALLSPTLHEKPLDIIARQSVKSADEDGNGKLSFTEFRNADWGDDGETPLDEETHMQRMFSRLDKNQDGFVDSGELQKLESGRIRREDVVDNLVEELDKDQNHHIDLEEFQQGRFGTSATRDDELQDYLIAWAKARKRLAR